MDTMTFQPTPKVQNTMDKWLKAHDYFDRSSLINMALSKFFAQPHVFEPVAVPVSPAGPVAEPKVGPAKSGTPPLPAGALEGLEAACVAFIAGNGSESYRSNLKNFCNVVRHRHYDILQVPAVAEQAITDYREFLTSSNVSQSTVRSRVEVARKFVEFIHAKKLPVVPVEPKLASRARWEVACELFTRKCSKGSATVYAGILCRFYRYCRGRDESFTFDKVADRHVAEYEASLCIQNLALVTIKSRLSIIRRFIKFYQTGMS